MERIVKEDIMVEKREYYFKTFTAQKNDMRKTWRTINDTLNSKNNKSKFSTKFLVNNYYYYYYLYYVHETVQHNMHIIQGIKKTIKLQNT